MFLGHLDYFFFCKLLVNILYPFTRLSFFYQLALGIMVIDSLHVSFPNVSLMICFSILFMETFNLYMLSFMVNCGFLYLTKSIST